MTIRRLVGTWVLLAVAMSANGIFRELVLRSAVGAQADMISAALGAVIILAVTGLLFRPFSNNSHGALVQSGLVLMAMTIVFEFAIGRWLDQKTWSELLGNYALWRGELWPLLLLLLGVTPCIWGRWLAPGARHAH